MRPEPEGSREDEGNDGSVPPWEMPGNFRRDCEPHRASLLIALFFIGLNAVGLSCLAGVFCVGHTSRRVDPLPPEPPPLMDLNAIGVGLALVALSLGVFTYILARQDLAGMRKGRVDSRGAPDTRTASYLGATVAVISAGTLVMWGMLLAN
jgi:hypothetical protein